MIQKILMGGLALAIIAVIGYGLLDAASLPATPEAPERIELAVTDVPTSTPETATPPIATPIPTQDSSAPDVTAEAVAEPGPMVQAEGAMGDPWQAQGAIAAIEDFGFTLTTVGGDYFVELGPPTYWQAQGIELAVDDTVLVDGYYNGEQVHARIVTVDGAQLVIRSESGQPLWAGGVDGGNGNGSTDHASGEMQAQVAPEDWLTLTGVIASVSNGNVTLNVDDGTVVNLQMGRPDFWQSQGITLSVGDPVEVLGFWSGDQFMAGDIRKTETGETIMLRDPNGRQLWSGPGRSGGQGGNGNQGDGGNGQGGNGGQGNGYRGGQ